MSANESLGGSPFVPRELRPDLAGRYEAERPVAPGISAEEMQARITAVGGPGPAAGMAWNQPFRAADHVSSTVLDGEAVLLDLTTSRYYSLNRVGAAIWEELAAGRTAGDLLAFVTGRYAVEDRIAAPELEHFLERLQAKGLTTAGEASAPSLAVRRAAEPYEQPVLTDLGPLTELTHKSLKERDKDQQKDDKDRADKDFKDNKDVVDKDQQDKGSVDKDLKDQQDKSQKDNKDAIDG